MGFLMFLETASSFERFPTLITTVGSISVIASQVTLKVGELCERGQADTRFIHADVSLLCMYLETVTLQKRRAREGTRATRLRALVGPLTTVNFRVVLPQPAFLGEGGGAESALVRSGSVVQGDVSVEVSFSAE